MLKDRIFFSTSAWEKASSNSSTPQEVCSGGPLERAHSDNLEDLKIQSFFPVIGLMEMKCCFSTGTNNVLRGMPALSPRHSSFLDKERILPVARHYGVREENLCAELHQVHRLLRRKEEQGQRIETTQEFLSLMRLYKGAFIDFFKLPCISLTLPMTSASAVSHDCTVYRTIWQTADSWTSHLEVLAINTDRTWALDQEKKSLMPSSSIITTRGLFYYEDINK